MLNTEIWSNITDLPYNISSFGNVERRGDVPYKHKSKKYVAPYSNNKGYLCINLYKDSKVHKYQIHRLIALAFIPNPDNLPEINHIDGNPLNNSLANLEWCTHQYNMQHAWDTELHDRDYPANAGTKHKQSSSRYHGVSWSEERKKWCAQLRYKKKLYLSARFDNEIEAARAIDNCIQVNNLTQFGYKLNFS